MNKIERKICEKIFPGKDAFDGWVPVEPAPPKDWKPYCYVEMCNGTPFYPSKECESCPHRESRSTQSSESGECQK